MTYHDLQMSDHANDKQWDSAGAAASEAQADGVGTIESYDTDDGVVFYDSENPLAWVQASATVRLEESV